MGKLTLSYTCTVRAPLGVSMALDRASIVNRKFTNYVAPNYEMELAADGSR